jgi:hypothetical protein
MGFIQTLLSGDIDVGKGISRAIGIGENTLPTIVEAGLQAFTGNYIGATQSAQEVFRQEQQRKNPPMNNYLNAYRSPGTDDMGGIIDVPTGNPQVYEGFVGSLVPQIPRIIGNIFSNTARTSVGRTVGGLATGAAGAALFNGGGGDSCGCGPKAFVRVNNCGQPIITRKMKKQAIEAVNCMGAAVAAQSFGISAEMLTQIISKQFPPRKMGISGAQLSTTMKTQRKLMRATKLMKKACK